MSLATKLAATTALSVWLHGARATMLGVRDHDGHDDDAEGHAHSSHSSTSTRPSTTAPVSPITETTSTSVVVVSTTVAGAPSISQVPVSSSSAISTQSSPSETLVTAMPSSIGTRTAFSTTTSVTSEATESMKNGTSGVDSDRTLVITLSTVLSAVGALLIIGAVVLCWRYRQRRVPFFPRGISPIDDDEIATWKVPRSEKVLEDEAGAERGLAGATKTGHSKQASTSSRKPPSVIVYNNGYGQGRPSVEGSPPGGYGYYGKMSLDRDLPPTPIQARAPNAVAGLTDESVPGADPFVSTPRRHPSRLSKPPPAVISPQSGHSRVRSSRSSMRSFGESGGYGGNGGYYGSSEVELSPRGSQDYIRPHQGHSRVYSSSELPPRLSLGDDGIVAGLSPRRLFRDEAIGRAIG